MIAKRDVFSCRAYRFRPNLYIVQCLLSTLLCEWIIRFHWSLNIRHVHRFDKMNRQTGQWFAWLTYSIKLTSLVRATLNPRGVHLCRLAIVSHCFHSTFFFDTRTFGLRQAVITSDMQHALEVWAYLYHCPERFLLYSLVVIICEAAHVIAAISIWSMINGLFGWPRVCASYLVFFCWCPEHLCASLAIQFVSSFAGQLVVKLLL